MTRVSAGQDVVVIGAGLAGLAAAASLAAHGARVRVLERRPEVGGRAYSYPHPALGEEIDSQHVLVGCCTNLRSLCEQAGSAEHIRWYNDYVFLEPNGNRSWLRPGILPAPSHQTLSFLRAPMLGTGDKIAIARGLMQFLRGYPESDAQGFDQWLRRAGQTDRAIRHFWEPVVVATLNDDFERCSTKYAGKVFHETFLKSPEGGRLGIPTRPLTEFFAPVAEFVQSLGAEIDRKHGADAVVARQGGGWLVRCGDEEIAAENVILATNFRETRHLLVGVSGLPEALRPTGEGPFLSAPITTIHLWFDREVTELDHAVLLDTRIQWMFNKTRIRRLTPDSGSYLELTISASWPELKKDRAQILEPALRELESFFPAVREAKLLKSGVLKEARATFSVTPGLDRTRPAQATGLPGLFVAGDWTATEWPSTMEGAVRSGRLAAGCMAGDRKRFLAPELPGTGLMRWLSRPVREI
jgi:squalene-associated FAD-dependent desaturase